MTDSTSGDQNGWNSAWKMRIIALCLTGGIASLIPVLFPQIVLHWFMRMAAVIAAMFTGLPYQPDQSGFTIVSGHLEVLVSHACSGTGFFSILSMLLTWRLTSQKPAILTPSLIAIIAAFCLTPLINGFRIVAVIELHRWIIPLLPQSWHFFLHMLTGVAVFLPVLIFINFLLESNARITRTQN